MPQPIGYVPKQPSEKFAVGFRFARWLDVGEAVLGSPSSVVTARERATGVTAPSILNGNPAVDLTDTSLLVQPIQAGTAGTDYVLQARVVTSGTPPKSLEAEIVVSVREE